jgi:hypothetical protein
LIRGRDQNPESYQKEVEVEQAVCSEASVREDPRYLSSEQLARMGVSRLNRYDALLKCKTCGTTWSPKLRTDATLPAGYWQCPNKCNW